MSDLSAEELKKAMMDALKESGRDLNLDSKDVDKVIESLKKYDKELTANRSTYKGLMGEMVTGRKVYKDLSGDLSRLDKSIKDLESATDENEIALRKELIQRREATQLQAQQNAVQKATIDGVTNFSKAIGGTAAKTMGGFVNKLQSGRSSFALAAGLMEGAIDGANAGAQALGGGMTALGSTMATSTNPRVKALGLISAGAGLAIGKLSEATAGLAKFVVNYMVKELESTVEAFNKTSAAGALFADGMTGMVNSALDAGLTVKQFSEVLGEQSATLGATGLGVAEAAKQMGGVGRVMRETGVTTNLLKLGYGFKEQAALVAETMRDMAGSGGPLRASNAQVARETEKYAENLRVISAITGEDAKAKADAAKKKASQLAFQQKLAQLEPAQRAAVQRGFMNMSELQQDNFMDMVNFGTVVNQQGAIANANSEAMAQQNQELFRLFQSGGMDADSVRELQKTFNGKIRQDLTTNESIVAIATAQAAGAGGIVGDIGKLLGKELEFYQNHTPEAIKAAEEAAKAQKIANDKLTTGVVTAAEEAQKLALALQRTVLPALGDFAFFTGKILEALNEQLEQMGFKPGVGAGGKPGAKQESWWDITKQYGSNALSTGLNYASAGGVVGAVGGLALGPGGAVAGGTAGTVAGGVTGVAQGLYETYQQRSQRQQSTSATSNVPSQGAGPDDPKRYSGIRLGGNGLVNGVPESIAGGPADPKLIELAKLIQQLYPGSVFNAFNDTYQRGAGSVHAQGKALDFKLPYSIKGDIPAGQQIVAKIKELGFGHVLDEYNFPSAGATGDHIHAQLRDGGIVTGTGGGINARIGEAGTSELVQPLRNGRIPGMDEMIDKLDQMISVMKDHKSVSENIFNATA
jgi:hypothetical protein